VLHVTVCGFDLGIDADRIAEPGPEVRRQVREYDRGERESFDLRVGFPDTFAGRVMEAMAAVPYGERRIYGELVAELATAPVAVGGANARNPLPVDVPCHRIVGADSLRGSRYPGLKGRLLRHEGSAGSRGFALDGSV